MENLGLLIASADEQRINTIRQYLGLAGLDVRLTVVSSWKAAYQALQHDNHELYLLDQALVAETDTSWITVEGPWKDRRWLLMLEEEDPELVKTALQAGAADFLLFDTLDQRQFVQTLQYAVARRPRPYQEVRLSMKRIRSTLAQAEAKLARQNALVVLHEEIVRFASEETATPEAVLKVVLGAVCTYTGWPVGHVYFVQEGKLVASDIWHYEDLRVFSLLYEATMDMTFSPGDGSLPGRVFDAREAVWIKDLVADPVFQRISHGMDLDVKAAFGFPVLKDETVLAVLEFFSTTVEPLDVLLLENLKTIGVQVGRVFERERAKKALRESKDRLRAFTEAAVEAVMTTDSQGRIVDWNRGATEIFGYEPREVLGQSLTMLMPEGYREAHETGMARMLATGKSRLVGKTIELEGLRKGGEVFPIELSLASWKVGTTTYFGGIIRDVTARKEAQEAVRESQAFVEAILASLLDLIAVLDEEGTIIAVNEAWKQVAREGETSLEKVGVGVNYLDICRRDAVQQDENAQAAILGIESVLNGSGEYAEFEYPCHTPTRRQWYRMAIMPLRGKGGAVVSHSDVTARRQAEEARHESEERFMLAVQGSHSGIWDWPDIQKGEEWWSPRFYELLGYEDGEIEASVAQFEALLHPKDRARTFALLEAHFEERVPFDIEYRLRTKAGAYRWFHARGEVLRDEQGQALRMAGSLTDVDERKRAEAALQTSQQRLRQLAARLQEVREVERTRLSREVHDVLGQALTGLRMDLAMIEKALTPEQPALRHRLDTMKEALDETVQVVRRIAHELRPGVLDDLGVLAAIEWETQRFASRTDIACTFIEDIEDLKLTPDQSTAVFRVFQEIMTNVARHAAATNVVVTMRERNGCVALIVQDNGRGIRREDLEKTTSLGLLGMRERLLPWEGQVDFVGVRGEGTTVTVTLPLCHPQPVR